MNIKRKYTDNQLIEAVKISYCVKDVMKNIGLKNGGGSSQQINNDIKRLNIDITHFDPFHPPNKNTLSNKGKSLEEIMVKNSTYCRVHLKRRLLKLGILKNICSECGQGEKWNGKQLVMVIDHINGVNNDNRLENLRILCPNCNSQQSTFAGKNVKNKYKYKCKICYKNIVKGRVHAMCGQCYAIESINGRIIKKSKESHYNVENKCKCGETINYRAKSCLKCFHEIERKVKERPSKEELCEMIKTTPFLTIGKEYGVSDNAIRKWAKQYGLPFKREDIKKLI